MTKPSSIIHSLAASVSLKASWALAAALACVPAAAQTTGLATASENTFGISASNHKYDEPGYMTLKATKLGLDFSSTYAPGAKWPYNASDAWFYKAQLSYASGKADYTSPISGNLNNTPHWYYEARALMGKDIDMGSYVLSPYAGLGYRHLYNNLTYDRVSNYTTLPVGFTHKINLADQSQLHTTFEYMHLLSGEQKVKLGNQTYNLDQRSGYGIRLDMSRRFSTWSMGPTLTYWHLGQSEVGYPTPLYEPKNNTLEIGLKGAYRF
jgi:hypothetical protein